MMEDEFEIVDLNVRSAVHVAKRLLRSMAAADEGRMLITSSLASTVPGSFQAPIPPCRHVRGQGQARRWIAEDQGAGPGRQGPACPAAQSRRTPPDVP
ncbi:hypothetical protein [Streptomyces sp. KS 21]|uniref:hypothetical protein n=1 Tax=Streptomyces sp. KS 21 TaxID=2485150 RepID=UPI001062A2E1|nr:hypothetical protein [Streptomyces sp. KS 21]